MSEPTFGTVYHTNDGKTVFIDPKTNQATVFEGVKTIEQILEPKEQMVAAPNLDAVKALLSILPLLPMAPLNFDVVLVPGQIGVQESSQSDEDILGPKDHYILVPKENEHLLKQGGCFIGAWVQEYKKGHKPPYKGHTKHRILAEQFDWLMNHKECSIIGWYSPECPAFVSLACQSHAKAMRPRMVLDNPIDGSEPIVFVNPESIITSSEVISAEEREI